MSTPVQQQQQSFQIRPVLELRTVLALAGERPLNAREEQLMAHIRTQRAEALYSDMLFALTRHYYPSRQAKELWDALLTHRHQLAQKLGRDMGLVVAAHDYLANVAGVLKGAAMVEEQAWLHLSRTASRDGLTGLFDKTTFSRLLAEELTRQSRHKRPVGLIMADIDHFKQLNDTFGHADGDAVLQQVGHILAGTARASDVVGRFGGEEFTIMLPETALPEATVAAERLRQAVQQAFVGTPHPLTLSLGVAVATGAGPEVQEALMRSADAALYAAKAAGRNCTRPAA